jgi:hypothetical protein
MDTSSLSILYIIISLASFLLFAKGLHLSLWSMLLTLDRFLWLLTTYLLKIPSIRIKEQAYQTLVRPSVEYASTVWNPYTKTEINKLKQCKEEQLDMSSTTRETDLVSTTCSRDSNGDLWQTGEKMQD